MKYINQNTLKVLQCLGSPLKGHISQLEYKAGDEASNIHVSIMFSEQTRTEMFLSESASNMCCVIIYVVMTLAVSYRPVKSNTFGSCSHFKRVPEVF